MTSSYNLPPSGKMPIFLRRMKFVFQPLEYLEDFAQAYGDSFSLPTKDGNNTVYFSQPEALEQIFTADTNFLKTGGNSILKFLVGDNSLILLNGDRHQRQRKLLTPPFHGDRMRTYGMTIWEIAERVSDKWGSGKPFNIRESMQEITLSVILRAVFGLDEGNRLDELRLRISLLLDFISSPLLSASLFFSFLQKDWGSWSPWGRVLYLRSSIDDLIYDLIEERRAESDKNREDILSLMMSARYEDGGAMSNEELRDELMTLLFAGHETTASALTWAFYWVDYLPEVREKLLKELNNLSENPEPSLVAKLPYLTAVCQETLRIYPIAMNAFPRIVVNPIEIGGYKLPKHTWIIPAIYLAHHREEVYPESKQFKPERFIERQFSPYEFFPFGGGNRRCIGSAFAMYEMKLVLATILSQYELSRIDKRPVKPVRRGLTLATPAGMKMIATPVKKVVKTAVGV
ncbi:cytochrome P450 [Plectonema cf. radiosum LEGE 06105]|uniref:Cytochrome P450 n=1 Tax=Plectonema cf. radiosum LEGE 06105 TaxID=945769 RepID=A0A8J7F0J2_9CYAN|nr:cytochrome P450 [Plectonema radiosum]MBE9212432.1 cytochrome P450 [Plectonema cf. radiosum LEGE 06105]